MEELDIASVTKRSIRGIFALTSRTFTIQVVSFVTNVLLTIFLTPAIFGVYFVVSAVIAFLSYFSDIGLAAALIQKKEQIQDVELRTTFTIQQILVLSLLLISFFLSTAIGSFYRLEKEGIYLFQACIVAFFLSSLKTIPSILLERNLRFEKLVIPQVVETLFFSMTVIFCAIKGFGIASFTYAVLARGISGLIAIYLISPWKIGFGFSKETARKLFSFGVPFQANSFLALIKDDLLIAYIGKVLPLSEVGFIGFAQKWAFAPLRLIMDNVIRVTFPSFSRLQNEKDMLRKAIEKSLFAATFFIFPALLGLVLLAPYFIHFVPKYQKWEPALLSLVFFSINAAIASISTPLVNALNAIGKVKITLYLMVFWTISNWILTPLAIFLYGFNGVAMASALIAVASIGIIFLVKRYVPFDFGRVIWGPMVATLTMGLFIYSFGNILISNLTMIFVMIGMGMAIYGGAIFLISRKQIIADIKTIGVNLKK